MKQHLADQVRRNFEEALDQVETFITTELLAEAKGAAIFARGGAQPFFLPLQFRVPLPTWIVANSTPNIYHLVELKDTYHRYVVMIFTQERARILEVNLGAVTRELWQQRPELRQRVGREWSKEHYQSHYRERTNRFIEELVRLAKQTQCRVEVVNYSDFLMEFGGVGCLLRYLTPEQYY